jgi:SAM-dependent methyltransferase
MNIELFTCRICGNNKNNFSFFVREMLFGTREKFEYVECSNCKCIQIVKIPDNLMDHYPTEYGTFNRKFNIQDNIIKAYFKKRMAKEYLEEKETFLTKYLIKKFGLSFLEKIKPANVKFNSKILDIGSGNGERLVGLSRYGFKNITGVDPYIKNDLLYNKRVKIYKKDFFTIDEKFDLVMLNHSFEHMENPEKVLRKINTLLDINSFSLIRIPVSDSYAWKNYHSDWVALDAPRHLFLHNSKTIGLLAEKTGFKLNYVLYDSIDYQFIGSEQFKNDIPMTSEKSYYQNKSNSIFSDKEIESFRQKAAELNKRGDGDAACFYLLKIRDIKN